MFEKPVLASLLALLGVVAAVFAVLWAREIARAPGGVRAAKPGAVHVGIGAITDFFDTLGIGSFATTTTLFRLSKSVDDRLVPGTLNVGHALPTVVQAFIYITLVEVDVLTLAALIAAAVLGSWLGSGIVARFSRRRAQAAMGSALVFAAGLMAASALGALPQGGELDGLQGARLGAGVAGNFVLGALMTAGVGLYAPCMVLVSLLGMTPAAAFPIMMGSCAFLMPAASVRIVRARAYDVRAALGLALGGIPAVLVAAFLVRSMALETVRWLVVGVVVFAAASLLRASVHGGS